MYDEYFVGYVVLWIKKTTKYEYKLGKSLITKLEIIAISLLKIFLFTKYNQHKPNKEYKKLIVSLISNKYKKNIFISNIHYTNVLSIIFLRNLNNLKIVLVERTPLMELSIYFGFIDFIKKNIIKLLIYLLYNLSDLIVCNSTSISKHFKKKYKLNTKTIFPPSVINSLKSNKEIYIKNKTLIISTVCRLTKEKGLDVLFQALSLLKFENYKLLIAGDGKEKSKLKKLSENLNISWINSLISFK